MKKLIIFFYAMMLTNILFGQHAKEIDYIISDKVFTFQTGIWVPEGNLKNKFSPSPNFGFKLGCPFSEAVRVDLGLSMNVPVSSEQFDFSTRDTAFTTSCKSAVYGVFGLWISHADNIAPKVFFNQSAGIGYGAITLDAKKPKRNAQDEDKWYSVETINFNVGLGLSGNILRNNCIGCFAEFNYAPFALFGRVNPGFGGSSLLAGLSYRF